MGYNASRCLAGLLVTAICGIASPTAAQPVPEITPAQVESSIKRGIEALKSKQDAQGDFDFALPGFDGGATALCTLALLVSGVKPDDPALAKALERIRERARQPKDTYVVAVQCLALCAAKQKEDGGLIVRLAEWLQATQLADGGWGYSGRNNRSDPSNSQFAVLALHEAEWSHDAVPRKIDAAVWRKALAYWEQHQEGNGAWSYAGGAGGSGSMTSAAVASLAIIAGHVADKEKPGEQASLACCAGQARSSRIDRGLRWLGDNFSVDHNPGPNAHNNFTFYYLCALERAGRLTGQRRLGQPRLSQYEWRRVVTNKLVREQTQVFDYWKGTGNVEGDWRVATSMALIVLSQAQRPTLLGKLQYGEGAGWNQHPEDAANLTRYVERKWGRELAWQVIDTRTAKLDDLRQCPVLYLSGKEGVSLEDAQVDKLRKYIEGGGCLLAEACCGDRGFDPAFRAVMQRMFPDKPLAPLPADHAVWRAEEEVAVPDRVDLFGIVVGDRTAVLYSARDLSCAWQHASPRRMQQLGPDALARVKAALAVGHNVVGFATKRELKYPYELWEK